MKRRARERLPKRAAGSFPSYLYKSLEELEGSWGDPPLDGTPLMEDCHALHRKPLLLLTDDELALALQQRIGLPWVRTLVLHRLAQDPLRGGVEHSSDALLRHALLLEPTDWGDLLPELQQIAALVPTLAATWESADLIDAYRRFTSALPA